MTLEQVLDVTRIYKHLDMSKFTDDKGGLNAHLFISNLSKCDNLLMIKALTGIYGAFTDAEGDIHTDLIADIYSIFLQDYLAEYGKASVNVAARDKGTIEKLKAREKHNSDVIPRVNTDYDVVIDLMIQLGEMGIKLNIMNIQDLYYIGVRASINFYNKEIMRMLPDLLPIFTKLYNECSNTVQDLENRYNHCKVSLKQGGR